MPQPQRAIVTRTLGPEALTRILDVTRKLAAPFDLATMLGEVVRAAKAVVDADDASLWLYEKDRHELVMRVTTGMEPIRVPADTGLVGECVRTRALINVPDCYADPRFNPEVDRRSGYHTRCMLTLPLVGHDDALVGVMQVLNKHGGTFDASDEELGAVLAAQCAVALQRVQMERLKHEVQVAREVQRSSWPGEMPRLAGYEIAGSCQPADETGGDTFDFAPLPGERLCLMMGDATGHGLGPALTVARMQAMLRLAVRLGASLDDCYRHVNNQLAGELPADGFVTAFLGVLDAHAHALEFHSPGQGPILHFHAASGAVDRHLPTTFPLGAFPVEQAGPRTHVQLAPGDIVALVSDGIFEWPRANGEEFGVERVEALLRERHGEGAQRLEAAIREAAAAFGAAQADDVTIVLVRRLPDPAGAADRAPVGAVSDTQLDRRLDALEQAVAHVRAFWDAHALPEADRHAVDFAIEEVFTNMIKYGKPGPTRIGLSLAREPGAVGVLLVDPDSERFDPTVDRKVDLAAPLEARQPGGLGLPLIRKLVDDFAYAYAGRESRISFRKRTGV